MAVEWQSLQIIRMCNTLNHSKHATFSLNSVKQHVWRVRKRRSSQYCVTVVFFCGFALFGTNPKKIFGFLLIFCICTV